MLLGTVVHDHTAGAAEGKIKALLITGGCCHDYDKQKTIIPTGIGERTNLKIEWKIIHQGGSTTDTAIPFYQNPNWAENFDVVVHNECFAGVKDKTFIDKILKPHKEGLSALVIHCAMHSYRSGDDRWFEFCGVTSRRHGAQHPFKVEAVKSDHWIMKGFQPWTTPRGELYFVEKVWPGATALTHSKSKGTDQMNVNAWVNLYEVKNARIFGTTIGHHNETMMDPHYLNMLTRGFLWSIREFEESSFRRVTKKTIPGDTKSKMKTKPVPGGGLTSSAGSIAKPQLPGKDSNGKSTTIRTPLFPAGKGALEKTIRIPKGYRATIFGRSPKMNFPTFVKATADGKVFVSVDKNGPQTSDSDRGKIVQIIDTDSDGVGDEYYDFVSGLNSPRDLEWDGEYLYVMHPPHLTRYRDTDGDHVADESQHLVDGIGFGFKDRPADHTANGVTLGIDGWLYLAIGDYGFMKAKGTDGRELNFRGGGVIRVRPDGSGLHVFARGTRNIYEVAVSPTLDVFARDNSGDSSKWGVRFHYFSGLEHHGYPTLFLNFGEEIVQPLADYRSGSGTGALWLAEPGFPKSETGVPLTVDWDLQMVYRHQIEPVGANFREIAQHRFIAVPRVNDIDVDGAGRLFVTSGASNGYVAMVTPPKWKSRKVPEFSQLKISGLIDLLRSGSHIIRLNAQCEILRRKEEPVEALLALFDDKQMSLETRAMALFTLAQIPGDEAFSAILKRETVKSDRLRALVFRALGDRSEVKDNLIFDALATEKDPRVINEMIVSIVRSETQDTGILLSVLAQANSSDPIVSHTAVRAITDLDASHICFVALDDREREDLWRGAMKALAGMHREEVVRGILSRLERTSWAGIRIEALRTLARLYYKEGDWKDADKGTGTDLSGPYFHGVIWEGTKVIDAALKKAMSDHRVDKSILLTELNRNHIKLDDLGELLRLVEKNPALESVAVAMILARPELPMESLPFLTRIAGSGERDGELRLRAATAMARSTNEIAIKSAFFAAAKSADVIAFPKAEKELIDALVNNPVMESKFQWLLSRARGGDARQGALAWEILFQLRNKKTAALTMKEEINQAVHTVGERGGNLLVRLVKVIGATRAVEWREIVKSSIGNEDKRVNEAALEAAGKLGIDGNSASKQEEPIPDHDED